MPPRAAVRKKIGSNEDSDEEDGGDALRARLAASKSKDAARNPKTANRSGKVTLSFGIDEDEGDDGESSIIAIKKSKASRNISKGKLSIPEFPSSSSSSSSTAGAGFSSSSSSFDAYNNGSNGGSGYDLESLAALRNAQKFTVAPGSSTSMAMDVSRETLMEQGFEVELGGEEAELLEQKMEAAAQENDPSSASFNSSSSRDNNNNMEDYYLIRNAKAQTAAWKKESNKYTDEDLSGGFTVKKEQTMQEAFACGGGGGVEIDEWEEELFKRGGLKIGTGAGRVPNIILSYSSLSIDFI